VEGLSASSHFYDVVNGTEFESVVNDGFVGLATRAIQEYIREIKSGAFPDAEHTYKLTSEEVRQLLNPVSPNEPVAGDWLVVLNDSHCTVSVGGPGYMWKNEGQSSHNPDCWDIGGGLPYSKNMFRKATPEEVRSWLSKQA
jgi:hypothetical protein